MDYTIRTYVLTPFEENCYLLYDRAGYALVIDPGEPSPELLEFVERHHIRPQMIILTHGHFDHMGGAAFFRNHWQVPVAIHEADAAFVRAPHAGGASLFGFEVEPVDPDVLFAGGEKVQAGDISLEVLHTPGHSPGGVTYYDRQNKLAFCGDLIFKGAVGRYDLPGSNGTQLFSSIRTSILSLPDEVALYPGHGPTTTVGYERQTNPFLRGM
jgi:glyoxylase-like metal-dependent hydrolase (beta-lactamase superfamily II)